MTDRSTPTNSGERPVEIAGNAAAQAEIEFRTFRVEARVIDGGGTPKISGYAAVFDSPSEEMGFFDRFTERISPGAFDTVLGNDVRALLNHDPNFVLGRTKSGTVRLSSDARGLHSEITPPDTQWARDLMVSMKRGDIDQMSFGFTVAKGGEHVESDGAVRVIDKIDRLFDVSVVTFPAYPATSVTARGRMLANRKGRQMEMDSSVIAAIANIDAMVDDLDEYVDTLMDDLGIPDPDEADEPEEMNSVITRPVALESRRGRRPRFTAVNLAKLNRRLHLAQDFALSHGITPKGITNGNVD